MWKSAVDWGHSRRTMLQTVAIGLLATIVLSPSRAEPIKSKPAESTVAKKRPSLPKVQSVIEAHFATDKNRGPNDIISRSEVATAFQAVKELGWDFKDAEAILAKTLEDSHVLVTSLRSPMGRKFMSKVSDRQLMYDRLDRISRVYGGPLLIQDLVKLPDGERYAKPKSGGGVPDLLDLLPKEASGTTRTIDNYDRATGRIYTVRDLQLAVVKSYRKEEAEDQRGAAKSSNGARPKP